MDAFFTSVEQADNPDLKGKPVIIGQSLRGVASAASYEARQYGVHSAMPIVQAQKLCPQGIYLPGRMHRYKEVSRKIMVIMRSVCPVIEQASVDEAYADITGTERLYGSPGAVAALLKSEILRQTGLTSSVGIAPCKYLAKIASDWTKPDGLTIIEPAQVAVFLAELPLRKIPGIGPGLLEELGRMGIRSVADIRRQSREHWISVLGKRGAFLHDRACGIDRSPVTPFSPPQSCSAENTLAQDTLDRTVLERWLLAQADRVGRELRTAGKKGLTVTLKIKYSDFTALSRSITLAQPTDITDEIFQAARSLLVRETLVKPVRLIGTGVGNFRSMQQLLPLAQSARRHRSQALDATMDRIRNKFGGTSIVRAETAADRTEGIGDLLSRKNECSQKK